MQRWRRKFGILRKSPEGVAVSGRRRLSSVARPDQAVPPDWVGQWVRGLLLEQAPRAVSACCLLALKLVFLMTILKIIQPLPVLILLIRACGDHKVNLSNKRHALALTAYKAPSRPCSRDWSTSKGVWKHYGRELASTNRSGVRCFTSQVAPW